MKRAAQPNPSDPAAPHVQALLDQHAFSLSFRSAARIAALAIAGVAILTLVFVALDHAFQDGLSRFGLGLAEIILLVAGIAALGVIGRAGVRRANPLFVARDLEKSRGIAFNAVLNWLLVRQDASIQYAAPVGARQAEAELLSPHGTPAPPAATRSPWWLLAGAGGAWMLFALVTPKDIGVSLRRLLGSAEAAPSATRIALLRPEVGAAVYAGEPVTLEFQLFGRSSKDFEFELRGGDGDDDATIFRQRVARSAPSGQPDVRTLTLAANEVARDLSFRARAGDGLLTGRIPVQFDPAISDYEVEITPPAYVQRPPTRSRSPEIEAFAGSSIALRVTATCDIESPVFVFQGTTETRTRMKIAASEPRTATTTLLATDSGAYWIEFYDRWGRAARNRSPHRLVIRSDQPPRLEIVEPEKVRRGADTVDLAENAWLRVAASDDWKLESLDLVFERSGVIQRQPLSLDRALRPGEVV